MVQSPSFQQSRTIEGGVRRIEGWIDGETQEKISFDQRILILLKIREISWISIKLRIQNFPNYWNVDERPELRKEKFPVRILWMLRRCATFKSHKWLLSTVCVLCWEQECKWDCSSSPLVFPSYHLDHSIPFPMNRAPPLPSSPAQATSSPTIPAALKVDGSK